VNASDARRHGYAAGASWWFSSAGSDDEEPWVRETAEEFETLGEPIILEPANPFRAAISDALAAAGDLALYDFEDQYRSGFVEGARDVVMRLSRERARP